MRGKIQRRSALRVPHVEFGTGIQECEEGGGIREEVFLAVVRAPSRTTQGSPARLVARRQLRTSRQECGGKRKIHVEPSGVVQWRGAIVGSGGWVGARLKTGDNIFNRRACVEEPSVPPALSVGSGHSSGRCHQTKAKCCFRRELPQLAVPT